MRPIEKSRHPRDEHGQVITFRDYHDAKKLLIDRIGSYCSYCERLLTNPAVEHKLSRDSHAQYELSWNNFLLSCTNCNSIKGHQRHLLLTDCIWPDRDNSFLAFVYTEGGNLIVNPQLPAFIQTKAQQTMRMTGLDRQPRENPQFRDQRWERRREAWACAVEAEQDLQNAIGSPQENNMRRRIASEAKQTGYWSVWMTVFQSDADMKQRFIDAFSGTSQRCFNSEHQPVPRRGNI